MQASARWAARSSEQTGAPLDRAGRIGVNPDLTLPGYPEVFVVGDMIDLDHLPGRRAGRDPGREVRRQGDQAAGSTGKPPQKPFHYFDKGSMATISRFRAVAMIGKLRLTGFIAWLLWLAVHLVYLTGFKNRVTALLHWAVSFLGRGRSERTATEQQIFGRSALKRLDAAAPPTWSPTRASTTPRGAIARGDPARPELEEQALSEIRLTDSGERGVHLAERHSRLRSEAPAATRTARGPARRPRPRPACPRGQDEDALGLDGHAVGVGEVRRRRRS